MIGPSRIVLTVLRSRSQRVIAMLVAAFALLAAPVTAQDGTDRPSRDTGRDTGRDPGRRAADAPPSVRPSRPAPVDRPPVTVRPSNIDLGFLPPKTIGSAVFTLTNTSDAPLTILDASPTCRCTTVGDHVGAVIEPGKPYAIEVHLDPATVPQSRSASVRILFDGFTRTIDLVVRGEVSNPVRTSPGWINVPGTTRPSGRMIVESIDALPFSICSVHGFPVRHLDFDPAVDAPRTRYEIQYDLTDFGDDELPGWLIIETDHPKYPVVDVRLRTEGAGFGVGIRGIRDLRIALGRITPGGSAETPVEFASLRQPIEFVSAESLSDDATVELLGQEGDQERLFVNVRVTPRNDFCGVLYLPVRLHTETASQDVIVFASVRDESCAAASKSGATPDQQPTPRPTPPADSPVNRPGQP